MGDRETAQAIARNRPPDRISFTEWLPITRTVERQRATQIFGAIWQTVTAWTKVEEEEVIGWRRKRMEFWDEPHRIVPQLNEHGDIVARDVPARTIGRWEWEERGA